MLADRWIRAGFLLIGGTTLVGPLVVSRGFTNRILFEAYPTVITPFVLLLLVFSGVAYVAVASRFREHRALVGLFAVVKLLFAGTWIAWGLGGNASLADLFAKDSFAGLFFASYGVLDLACALFFLWVTISLKSPAGTAVQDG